MNRRPNRRNVGWETPEAPHFSWEHVGIEVLMDIREELQSLNMLLRCQNFLNIPKKLDVIADNTKRRRRKKKAVAKTRPTHLRLAHSRQQTETNT